MKRAQRFLSFILALTVLVSLFPATGIADAAPAFSLTLSEVEQLENLSGLDKDVYRKGTPYSKSMSAYQVYCWLAYFDEEQLGRLIMQAQLLIDEIGDDPVQQEKFGRVYELKYNADRMQRDVRFYMFELNEQMSTIRTYHHVATDSSMDPREQTDAYRRMQQAGITLKDLLSEIAGAAPNYETDYSTMSKELSEMHTEQESSKVSKPTLDGTVLLGAATPFANLLSAGFYIDVVDVTEAGFFVCDENGRAIPKATVTVSTAQNSISVDTDEHGIAKFDTGAFAPDKDGRFLASICIRADQHRVWESCGLYITTGTSRKAVLPVDDGTPYIQRADFRGMDVLHDQDVVYCTPDNDAMQSFKVYVHAGAGQRGTLLLDYTDVNGTQLQKRAAFTGSANKETQIIDLSSRWARELYPNTPFILSLVNGLSSASGQTGSPETPTQELSLGIVPKKAVVNRPVTQLADGFINPGMNMSFNIPFNMAALKSIEIGVQIPQDIANLFPVTFSFDPSGEYSLGIAFSRSITKGDDDGWKTVNSRDTEEDWNKSKKQIAAFKSLIKGNGDKDALKGEMKDAGHISEAKLVFTLMLVLTGKFEEDSKGNCFTSDATLMFQGSFGGSYTFQHYLLAYPPVFFLFETGAHVSGGAAITFSVKADENTDASNLLFWRDAEFNKEETEIFFGARFSLSASLGIGIRYALAAYVRGFFGISAGITLTPWADDVFDWFVHMEAGLDVVVEALFIFSGTFHILSGEWDWPDNDSAALTGASPDASGALAGVKPTVHKIPSDLELPEGMKTACVYAYEEEEQYLGFYLVDGQMRVASIHYDGFNWSIDELDSNGLFGTKALVGEEWRGEMSDRYIYDFAAASMSESEHSSEFTEHFIAVTLLMALHQNDVPDPNDPDKKIPGETTFGETVYLKYSAEARGKGVLTLEGGSQITPKQGIYMGVSIDFGYLSTSKTSSIIGNTITETYCVTSSMMNRDDRNEIYTHTEKLEASATTSIFLKTKPAKVQLSHEFDHAFDLRPACQLSEKESVLSYQVRSYYQAKNIFLLQDEQLCVHCVVLITDDVTGDSRLVSVSAIVKGDTPKESRAMISSGELDHGNISHFVLLGTEKRTSILKSSAIMYLVFKDPDDSGRCEAYLEKQEGSQTHRIVQTFDLGIRVAPASCYVTRLSDQVMGLYYPMIISPDGSRANMRYEYKALYLVRESASKMYISKPFTMAVFDKADLDPEKGVISIDMMRRPAGFLQGVAVSEETQTPGEGSIVSHFIIQQMPQIRIDGAAIDNPLVRAGDTVNVLMTVTNTGNIPASAFMVSLVAEDINTGAKTFLSQYKVNCADPAGSMLEAFDLKGQSMFTETGEKAVSRFELGGSDRQSFWIAEDGSAMLTKVLMPEESVNYRVPFTVPKDFAGHQYNVTLSVNAISMLAAKGADGRYDSTGCWIYTLQQAPDGLEKAAQPLMASGAPEMVTLTALLPDEKLAGASGDGTTPVTLIAGDIPMGNDTMPVGVGGTAAFSAYGNKVKPSSIKLDMGSVDLALDADLYELNGEPYVYVSITNLSSTGASGVKLNIQADGTDILTQCFPDSFLLTCSEGISMDIPISPMLEKALGDEKDNVDRLTLKVSCDQKENNLFNNTETIYLLRSFVIVKHPEDQTLAAGTPVSFDVTARGGTRPYSYQWQVSTTGRNGTYTDIPGATDRILKMDTEAPAKAEGFLWNNGDIFRCLMSSAKADGYTGKSGNFFRCIVTDATGVVRISKPALLLLTVLPPTGDSFAAPLWCTLAGVSLLTLVCLTARRKKKRT